MFLRDFIDLVDDLFETEDKFRQALKRYGARIEARLAGETEANQQQIEALEGETIPEKVIRFLKGYDPTPQGTYTDWIVSRWLTGHFSLEDIKGVSDNLRIFNNKRDRMPTRDIQQVKTAVDLARMVTPFVRVDNALPDYFRGRENEIEGPENSIILRDDSEWLVVFPKTMLAAQYWGCHTGTNGQPWCIAWGIPKTKQQNAANQFDNYTRQGKFPFILLFDKRGHGSFRDGPAYALRLAEQGPVLTLKENGPEIDAIPYLTGDLAPVMTGKLAKIIYERYPWMLPDFWQTASDEKITEVVLSNIYKRLPLAIQHDRVDTDLLFALANEKPYEAVQMFLQLGKEGQGFVTDEFIETALMPSEGRNTKNLAANLLKLLLPRGSSFLTRASMTALCSADGTLYQTMVDKQIDPPIEAKTAALKNMIERHREGDHIDPSAFASYPISAWPDETIVPAIQRQIITLYDAKKLDDDQQKRVVPPLLVWLARNKPEDFPKVPERFLEMVHDTDEEFQRIKNGKTAIETHSQWLQVLANSQVLPTIPDRLISDKMIIKLVDNHGIYSILSYLPPHRITRDLLTALTVDKNYSIPAEPESAIRYLMQNFAGSVMSLSNDPYRLKGSLRRLPPHFRTPMFANIVAETAKRQSRGYNSEYRLSSPMLQAWHEEGMPITPELAEAAIKTASVSRNERTWGTSVERVRQQTFKTITDLAGWDVITSEVLSTALRLGAVKPDQVPDDRVTPQIATQLFMTDPDGQQHRAHHADDESLISAIRGADHYGTHAILGKLPRERINEPIAHAHLSRGYHVNGKELIPPQFRSKRVYQAGVGRAFQLKDVPKKWRDDEMAALAVSRNPEQIKQVADPLRLLNAPASNLPREKHWVSRMEANGYVQHDGRYVPVSELPTHELPGGWRLHVAKKPKGERFLFLGKDGVPFFRFAVRRGKVILESNATQENRKLYGSALRDVARQFLEGVDISNLNVFDIYQTKDGVKGENQSPREEIEGIGWSKTPHKSKTKITAWVDDVPVFTMLREGWKIKESNVLDPKLAVPRAAQIAKGLKAMSPHDVSSLRWSAQRMGIAVTQRGFVVLADKKIGKLRSYTFYWSPVLRRITAFGEKGLIAEVNVLKSGKRGSKGVEIRNWLVDHKDYKDEARRGLTAAAIVGAMDKLVAVVGKL